MEPNLRPAHDPFDDISSLELPQSTAILSPHNDITSEEDSKASQESKMTIQTTSQEYKTTNEEESKTYEESKEEESKRSLYAQESKTRLVIQFEPSSQSSLSDLELYTPRITNNLDSNHIYESFSAP